MNWKAVAETLRAHAPAVAQVLATGNPAAGLVLGQVSRALNAPATPEGLGAALSADPEAAERLAAIEAEVALAQIADMQHARETTGGHWMPPVLTLVLAGLLAASGWGLFVAEIPAANRDMANIAFGAMLGAFTTSVSYWLGSSRGSAEKQEIMRAGRG